jgi:hypothetical protein
MKTSKIQQALGGLFISGPEVELGPNYETVLNFWLFLDSLTSEQEETIIAKYAEFDRNNCNAGYAERIVKQAGKVVLDEQRLWFRVNNKIFAIDSWLSLAITWATHELVCMHELIGNGEQMVIIPLFCEGATC